jgi:hypothetical protein
VNITGDTMSGALNIVSSAEPALEITNDPGSWAGIALNGEGVWVSFRNQAGLARWELDVVDSSTESGSNQGSDFNIAGYNDDGTGWDIKLKISRNDSNVVIYNGLLIYNNLAFGMVPSEGIITTGFNINADVALRKGALGVLALRGTNSQFFRVYNTYVDATNYERGAFDWFTNANQLTIGTEAAGTGVQRDMLLTAATANVLVNRDPTVPLGVATKQYVDSKAGGAPGAPANSIQFNNANIFGGDANLTWVPGQELTDLLATAIGPSATIHAGTGSITPNILTDWYNSYQDPVNESAFANVASPLAICQTYSADISTANRVMALSSRVNVKHTGTAGARYYGHERAYKEYGLDACVLVSPVAMLSINSVVLSRFFQTYNINRLYRFTFV